MINIACWSRLVVATSARALPIAGNAVAGKGMKSDAMFEFIDIYPTLAELMTLENTPEYLEGKSFASVVKNPEKAFKNEIYAITRRGDMIGNMVKTKAWRYIEWDEGKKGAELYDQKNDPQELNNLAQNSNYSAVIAEMKTLLAKK